MQQALINDQVCSKLLVVNSQHSSISDCVSMPDYRIREICYVATRTLQSMTRYVQSCFVFVHNTLQ